VARAHLENTVRSLNAEIIDRERLATLAAMRARLLHDLGNLNLAVQGSCLRLESLLGSLKTALDRELFVLVQDAVSNLRMAVDHITSLHQKREQAARLTAAAKGYYPVTDIFETVRELMRGELNGSTARLLTEAQPNQVIWADRTDVSRILMNLISNAMHAIEGAGIHGGEIRLRATPEGSNVTITVQDNGPGVPQRLAKRIFEPAFTTRSERGGSGLGLAICRELAHANDGTVELLESVRPRQVAGGAQFVVRLPSGPQRA
jgi:signal transduction histidine kinase